MKVVLENARLADSVKPPVQVGVPFLIELTVSPDRPGVSGADGVTFECPSDKYTIAPPLVNIAIPLGKKTHTENVNVVLESEGEVDAAMVHIKASAGNEKTFSVMTRKPEANKQ